jgi:hypothetical protein
MKNAEIKVVLYAPKEVLKNAGKFNEELHSIVTTSH